jgi:hypothetical protein
VFECLTISHILSPPLHYFAAADLSLAAVHQLIVGEAVYARM